MCMSTCMIAAHGVTLCVRAMSCQRCRTTAASHAERIAAQESIVRASASQPWLGRGRVNACACSCCACALHLLCRVLSRLSGWARQGGRCRSTERTPLPRVSVRAVCTRSRHMRSHRAQRHRQHLRYSVGRPLVSWGAVLLSACDHRTVVLPDEQCCKSGGYRGVCHCCAWGWGGR